MLTKRCVVGASSLCTTVVWNVWSGTTFLDVHGLGRARDGARLSTSKKLFAEASCLSSIAA